MAFYPQSRRRGLILWFLFLVPVVTRALDGARNIHDPSTMVKCDGVYYVFGTGRGIPILSSADGFTWSRAGKVFEKIPESVHAYVPKNNGEDVWAPDILPLNGEYYLYYSISSWGQFVSAVGLLTSPTLDPRNPRYKWTDRGMVVHSSEGENLNAIDPGVLHAPDGTLWICYGSYHGNIELVELDPRTGLRPPPAGKVYSIATQSEASDIIYREGYYYLFVNHGSCCQGKNSTYNIRVGRAKAVTGPYLDRDGEDLAAGAGTLFVASAGTAVGPGHFGIIREDGVEKFSCHYEADVAIGGRSLLEVRPLLWTLDGWPRAGEDVRGGKYQVRSLRWGNVLAVGPATAPGGVQVARYNLLPNQQWTITPAGNGLYRITTVADQPASVLTGKGLPDAATISVAASAGGGEQLWRVDQLSDGSYRLESQLSHLALTALSAKAGNGVGLEKYTGAAAQRWEIVSP